MKSGHPSADSKLTIGKDLASINLMQPWADAVVDGLLPILVRPFRTHKRGIVGIAATEGIDGVLFSLLSNDRQAISLLAKVRFNRVIGMIRIEDCYEVSSSDLLDILEEEYGEELAAFYPVQYIPERKSIYLWKLMNPIRFAMSLPIDSKGITWSKTRIVREFGVTQEKSEFWKEVRMSLIVTLNEELRRQRKMS